MRLKNNLKKIVHAKKIKELSGVFLVIRLCISCDRTENIIAEI
jgi:hypothetical protein